MHKFRNDSLKLGVCIADVKSASQPSFLQVTNATGVRLQSQPSACLLPSLGNQGSHSNDIIKIQDFSFSDSSTCFFMGELGTGQIQQFFMIFFSAPLSNFRTFQVLNSEKSKFKTFQNFSGPVVTLGNDHMCSARLTDVHF